ncbi:hypothetical protein EV561_103397 [Rhizobium sp. BK376]|jgi:hypothetical protein|nr:hypothetical protein EV561_103397 [Rhizobium sp. BK376]
MMAIRSLTWQLWPAFRNGMSYSLVVFIVETK